jgi:hypothetical protein
LVIPTDPGSWFKIVGAIFTVLGSILLAWRAKAILEWVKNCLVAHEVSIQQLNLIANGRSQTQPVITGSVKHLLRVEDKLGIVLLMLGFSFLAVGMVCNAASYFFV